MEVMLQHESGVQKKVKMGFSWTVFFFGMLVPLFRGDLKWAAIMFLTILIAGSVSYGLGGLLISFIFAFIYNKMYIKELIEKGYRPPASYESQVLNYIS